MAEHQVLTLKVKGSNPLLPTTYLYWGVAQMVEHSTDNRKVAGSSPVIPTMYMKHVSEFGFKLPLVCKSRGVSSYIVETAGSNSAMLAYTPKNLS